MAYPYPITPGAPGDSVPGPWGIFRSQVYVYGTTQFTLLGPYPTGPYNYEGPFHVYKSTDAGVTWAIVDGANAPIVMNRDDLSEPSSRNAVLKAGTDSVILLPYVKWLNLLPGDKGGEMCFVEFDMATETWGTPVEGGPRVMPTDVSDEPCCKVVGQYCPTTDKYVFVFNARWGAMLPAPYSHKPVWSDIVECSGAGVWGVAAIFAGDAPDTYNSVIRGVVADPDSEKLHFIWITQQWGSTAVQYSKMYHTLYTPSTSTLGAAELIDTGTGAYGEANAGIGVYAPAVSFGSCVQQPILTRSGHIAVPFVMDRAVPDQLFEPYPPSMVIAEFEDSPTWTKHPVPTAIGDQITTGSLATGGWQLIDAGAGRIRGYWSNPDGANGFVLQVADFSLITMTWGPPDVAYTHTDDDFSDQLSASVDLTPVMPVWYEATPLGPGETELWMDSALSFYGNVMLFADAFDAAPGSGRLWLSTDYGATWTETRPAGDVDRSWDAVALSADGSIRVAGCSEIIIGDNTGKLYVYSGGAWAEVVPEPANPIQWWSTAKTTPSGSTILAGSWEAGPSSGFLYLSTNTGATWTKLHPKGIGVQGSWQGLAISDDGQTILVGEWGGSSGQRLWRSTNGGAAWTELQPAGNVDLDWPALTMSRDGQTMYAGANPGRLYKSVNGGGAWTELQPAGNNDQNWFRASMSLDKKTVFVSPDGGQLWVSTDSGSTWTATQPVGPGDEMWDSARVSGEGSVFNAAVYGGLAYVSTPQEPTALILATNQIPGVLGAFAMDFWELQGAPAPPSPFDLVGEAAGFIPSGAAVLANGIVSIGGSGGFGGGGAPPPGGNPAHFPGWPVWPPVFRLPNFYDKCLQAFKCHIQKHPMQDASRCVDMLELWSGELVPRNCKEFWETFKVVTPIPGETLVGGFRVPVGYAGMLYGIHLGYTGTGFLDGSGDIYWRVTIGNAWASRGLGNVSTQLGIPGQCLQLTDYIKLKSNQLVQVWVNVPNVSGNIQVGNSRILATLQGWFYPA